MIPKMVKQNDYGVFKVKQQAYIENWYLSKEEGSVVSLCCVLYTILSVDMLFIDWRKAAQDVAQNRCTRRC